MSITFIRSAPKPKVARSSPLANPAFASAVQVEEQVSVSMVPGIVAALDPSYHGFIRASQMYNTEFFEGESREFRVTLVRALKETYSAYPNSYWNKVLVNEQSLDYAPQPFLNIASAKGNFRNKSAKVGAQ